MRNMGRTVLIYEEEAATRCSEAQPPVAERVKSKEGTERAR